MATGLTLSAVIIAALVDSINPCAFGVMIFLITYLLAISSKKHLLKVGLVYIFTVFLVYLLAGLGILSVLQKFTFLTYWIYKIAAIILVVSGLINLKEMFWYKKGPTLAIPESSKKYLEKYIHKGTIFAAVILGFLVATFELPCTGQVYLGILSLLAHNNLKILGFLWLLIYNLIFISPLLVILLFFYWDKNTEWFKNLTDNKKKWMRFIAGLVMLILGILMLLSKI